MTTVKPWRLLVTECLEECIQVVKYDVTISDRGPRTAQLQIDVRHKEEREDEMEYWLSELQQLPFMTVVYKEPSSIAGPDKIRFSLKEAAHIPEMALVIENKRIETRQERK